MVNQVMQSMCIDCRHQGYIDKLRFGEIFTVPHCEKGHNNVITSVFRIEDCPDREESHERESKT